MPPSVTSFPMAWWPKQPKMSLKGGRLAGRLLEAAGCPNSKSKTTTCMACQVTGGGAHSTPPFVHAYTDPCVHNPCVHQSMHSSIHAFINRYSLQSMHSSIHACINPYSHQSMRPSLSAFVRLPMHASATPRSPLNTSSFRCGIDA